MAKNFSSLLNYRLSIQGAQQITSKIKKKKKENTLYRVWGNWKTKDKENILGVTRERKQIPDRQTTNFSIVAIKLRRQE